MELHEDIIHDTKKWNYNNPFLPISNDKRMSYFLIF